MIKVEEIQGREREVIRLQCTAFFRLGTESHHIAYCLLVLVKDVQ